MLDTEDTYGGNSHVNGVDGVDGVDGVAGVDDALIDGMVDIIELYPHHHVKTTSTMSRLQHVVVVRVECRYHSSGTYGHM